MSENCVIVADGARARFFTLEAAEIPHLEGGPNLVEHSDLTNPEQTAQSRELFSNERGRHKAHMGGPPHGYDDHRDDHEAVLQQRFAKDVAERAASFVREHKPRRCVIAADPTLLGMLRPELNNRLNGVSVVELDKDLSKLSRTEIHEHLAQDKLVPARKPPTG